MPSRITTSMSALYGEAIIVPTQSTRVYDSAMTAIAETNRPRATLRLADSGTASARGHSPTHAASPITKATVSHANEGGGTSRRAASAGHVKVNTTTASTAVLAVGTGEV